MTPRALAFLFCLFLAAGCENTDILVATDAGLDAMKAATLSDNDVREIASQASRKADASHSLAPDGNGYAKRLARLTGGTVRDEGLEFNFGVYLSPEVNAFAMADGTIRVYSGLMDMLDDGELRFVIGHEMGHVKKNHIRKKIQLAYAASAVRKGIASQNSSAGDAARSVFGGLAETLLNAQFSQLEEKEADDYGLAFLRQRQYEPKSAVSALRKLAKLGKGHSFLSSHPDPDLRADRLQAQLEGRAKPIDENKKEMAEKSRTFLQRGWEWIEGLWRRAASWSEG